MHHPRLFAALACAAISLFVLPAPAEAKRFKGDVKNLVPEAPLPNAEGYLPSGGETKLLDPALIRFTQASCSVRFRDGRSVEALIADLKAGRISAEQLPPLRVFVLNGAIWSLDNRRLHAFKTTGLPVRVVRATAKEIQKESYKYSTANGGRSIEVRGNGPTLPPRTVSRGLENKGAGKVGGLLDRLPGREVTRDRIARPGGRPR